MQRTIYLNWCAFFLILATLASCSTSQPSPVEIWAQPNGKIKVLSTTAMIDDIVGQIGKDRIDHIVLITGEIDPHSYELVKGDGEKLSLAQVIFYSGLGLEHGASLRYQLEHHPNAIGLGNRILEKYPNKILHVDQEIDPHIWMDISLWSHIIDPIVDSFCQIDPSGENQYRENAALIRTKMLQAHNKVYEDLQNVPEEKRYLVTSHDAFNYFTRAYLATPQERVNGSWHIRFDAPEGLAPEGQISATDIQAVIDHLIKYRIQTVFPESNVSRDSLMKVVHACKQKGLYVTISSQALYGDSMGPSGAYLPMIQHDADVLIHAWDTKS